MALYAPLVLFFMIIMLFSRNKTSLLSVQTWATLLVALSGILYGFIGYFGTRIIDEGLSVSNMLFWRFFIAFLWISVFSFFRKEKIISSLKQNKSTLLKTFLFASLTYSGASVFYFMASQEVGTGLAMVIFFSYPVFVAIWGWVRKRMHINIFSFSSLVAIIVGIYLLKGHGEASLSFVGIILAIAASLAYAFYIVSSKRQTNNLSSDVLTFLVCLGNMIFFFILSLSSQALLFPTTLGMWVNVIALGIFATALPIQLLLDGLTYISTLKTSILSVLEPVMTLIAGVILLHESINEMQVIGIFIVLMGAILIQFER